MHLDSYSAAVLLASALAIPAHAQSYPSRPVTMIVPFAAGGPADALSRTLAIAMGKRLKQTIVIENVGGAGGTIGVARAAKATPDGYTILYNNIAMATASAMYRTLPYDPLTDFEYVGVVGSSPNVLIGRVDLPVKDFADFISYVKTNKDKISFANSGVGGPSHLCGLLFMNATQTQLTNVPYKGTGPAMNDLLGKQVDLLCDAAATAAPQILAGKVRAFGITGKSRLAMLPDVPTLDEQSLKGFEMVVWNGIYAPKKTPKTVIDRLVAALHSAQSDPDVLAYFGKSGSQVPPRELATPMGLHSYLKSEIERWTAMMRNAGIKPE